MKVALFEIGVNRIALRYTSSTLEIAEMERLKEYIQDLISQEKGMQPKK